MTTERKARELLREAYAKRGWIELPAFLRTGSGPSDYDEIAIEAITRALESAGRGDVAPCEDCEGSGLTGNVAYQGLMEPPEHEACPSCGGSGKWRVAPHQPKAQAGDIGPEWTPCRKRPVVVHVREQRLGEHHVSTREGITPIKPDDLIMRGVAGEEYPIGRALFEQTYDLVSDEQPEAQAGGAVAIPADSVDGELSVEQAINELCEMHPGADRLAMKLLAALFTHKSVIRYRAYTTPPAKVPEVLLDFAERIEQAEPWLHKGARFTRWAKEIAADMRERAAMLAAAPEPGEG